MKNNNYQLVKLITRYNKQTEIILKTHWDKNFLIELKKNHKDTSNTKYIIRPEITVIKNA